MKYTEMMITPEIAKELLATNTRNRSVSSSRVRGFARDMSRGRWKLTHQSIAIGADGVLLDGQHRLLAVLESGVSVPMVVAHDTSPDTFDSIDIGGKRTAGDTAFLRGVKSAPSATSAVLWLRQWDRSRFENHVSYWDAPTNAEQAEMAVRLGDELTDAINASSTPRVKLCTNRAFATALMFVAGRQDRSARDRFTAVLRTGIPSGPGCAAHALRERMLRESGAKVRLSAQHERALWMIAWREFARGRKVNPGMLRWAQPNGWPAIGYDKQVLEGLAP